MNCDRVCQTREKVKKVLELNVRSSWSLCLPFQGIRLLATEVLHGRSPVEVIGDRRPLHGSHNPWQVVGTE